MSKAALPIPITRKPVTAVGKTTQEQTVAITRDPGGRYHFVGELGGIEQTLKELRGTAIGDPEPQPEPETRTRKPMSDAHKAKLAAGAKLRAAKLRAATTAQEGETKATPATTAAKKRKPKTLSASGTA